MKHCRHCPFNCLVPHLPPPSTSGGDKPDHLWSSWNQQQPSAMAVISRSNLGVALQLHTVDQTPQPRHSAIVLGYWRRSLQTRLRCSPSLHILEQIFLFQSFQHTQRHCIGKGFQTCWLISPVGRHYRNDLHITPPNRDAAAKPSALVKHLPRLGSRIPRTPLRLHAHLHLKNAHQQNAGFIAILRIQCSYLPGRNATFSPGESPPPVIARV